MIGLSQGSVECSLLTVTDITIDNGDSNIDISIHNGDTMSPQYTYLSHIIDSKGDTTQLGNGMDHFAHLKSNTEIYHYHLSNSISLSYPIKINFTYTDFNLGGIKKTCLLNYKLN